MTLDEILSDLLLGRCTVDEARNLIDWIMFQQSRASAVAERKECKQACEEQIGTVSMFASAKLCRTYNKAVADCVKAISARGES